MCAWVKLDDQFADHPKAAEAGPLGIAMQVAGLCYCNRHLTDGFISRAVAARLLDFTGISVRNPDGIQNVSVQVLWSDIAESLENAGLWSPCDGGWMIHDYLEYNPSKAETVAKREADLARKQNAQQGKRDSRKIPPGIRAESKRPVPVPVSSSLRSEELTPPTPDAFADFFAAYPRHDARAAAEKAWNARTAGEQNRAMAELPRWKGCEQWQDPKYIPQASTYLNQRRFDDELPPPSHTPSTNGSRYQSQADHNQLRRDANGKLINVH